MTTGTVLGQTATIELDQLRADIGRLAHVATFRTAASPAAIKRSREELCEIAARWLPLARERREAATGSAADQARWDTITAAATPKTWEDGSFSGLVVQTGQVRDLLRAIQDSNPPHIPVADVARCIADAITDGAYPVGSSLALGRLASHLGETVPRVRLALSDLATAGIVEDRGGRSYVVEPGGRRESTRERLARRLREQIAAGVYPPGTALPTQADLAHSLVSALGPMADALRILAAEGTLVLRAGQRTVVDTSVRIATPHAEGGPLPSAVHPNPDDGPPASPVHIRKSTRVPKYWWKSRVSPQSDTLDYHLNQLRAFTRQLIPEADAYRSRLPVGSGLRQHVRTVIARAVELDSASLPSDITLRVWHAACLATAVSDLLQLTEAADNAGQDDHAAPRAPDGRLSLDPPVGS
ncbi:DUF6415 family natural product biosynthesis protein [Streptomyces sp. NPDC004647]|uniref:DUF6415 family natural product biosynthesis protein n=1 Tax=Streptomyces sp. NPDC004647 TaxID=3154671 RepID=UPI0033B1EDDE